MPGVQGAIHRQPPLGRDRRRILLSRFWLAGYVEAVLRRNPDASQQPIPAQLCGQRREERKVRARACSLRSSKRGVPDAFGSVSAARRLSEARKGKTVGARREPQGSRLSL